MQPKKTAVRVLQPGVQRRTPPPLIIQAVFLCPEFGLLLLGGSSREPQGSIPLPPLTCMTSPPPIFLPRLQPLPAFSTRYRPVSPKMACDAAVYTWQNALTLAEGKSLAVYGDWRMPNIKELRSIVEGQCSDPAINLVVFPNTPASAFWSASPSSVNSNYAWFVEFDHGYAYDSKRYAYGGIYVRLVRSGQ